MHWQFPECPFWGDQRLFFAPAFGQGSRLRQETRALFISFMHSSADFDFSLSGLDCLAFVAA